MEGIAVRAETHFSGDAGKGIWTRQKKMRVSKMSAEILKYRGRGFKEKLISYLATPSTPLERADESSMFRGTRLLSNGNVGTHQEAPFAFMS